MKGNQEVIDALNGLLSGELAAVNQYMVHSEMSANWGYDKLHKHFENHAHDEMKHAEKLIARVLFLEGVPVVNKLNEINIGSAAPEQMEFDHQGEETAIIDYNAAIKLAGDKKDFATREILEEILNDEDRHIDEIEALQDQIAQMGLALFLSTRV